MDYELLAPLFFVGMVIFAVITLLLFVQWLRLRDELRLERAQTHVLKSIAFKSPAIAMPKAKSLGPVVDLNWYARTYPLKQVHIHLQGTRHSSRGEMVAKLEMVAARLRAGDQHGEHRIDDCGYLFEVTEASQGPSLFETNLKVM